MKKRSIVYGRVSTDKQEEHGYSLQSQVEGGKEYARKNGFSVVAVLSESVSGTIPIAERPEGKKMYEMVDKGQVDAIILFTHDRTARDERVLEYLLFKSYLHERGVELHFSDTGLDPYTMEGNLVGYIKAHTAAEERLKIKRRMSQGRRDKAKAGKWIGNIAPFGYRKIDKGRDSYLEIDEENAAVVQRMFDMYLGKNGYQPMTLKRIAVTLTQEGIKTARDKAWGTTSVSLILSCRSYTGVFHYKDIDIPLPHLRIIDDATFDAAQKRRKVNAKKSQRNAKHEFLLRGGYFRCTCGRSMNGMSGFQGKYLYYRCCGRARRFINGCQEKSWGVQRIDTLVWDWFSKLLGDDKILETGIRRMIDRSETDLAPKRTRLEDVINQLELAERQVARLAKALREADNEIVEAALNVELKKAGSQIEGWNNEKDRLEREILQGELSEEEISAIKGYSAILREEFQIPDYESKRYLIDRLGLHVQLLQKDWGYGLDVSCRLKLEPETLLIENTCVKNIGTRLHYRVMFPKV